MKYSFWFFIIGGFCFSFVFGMLVHKTLIMEEKLSATQISELPKNIVPTISLEKIENGILYFSSPQDSARITLPSGEIVVADEGKGRISVIEILPMLKILPAPEGSLFVASKRGSSYWPLDHPRAFILSPKNRVFYKSVEEAEAAGKKPGIP